MTSLKETSKFALRFSAAPVILGAVRMVFGIKTEGTYATAGRRQLQTEKFKKLTSLRGGRPEHVDSVSYRRRGPRLSRWQFS
jgi:hypothetical protein